MKRGYIIITLFLILIGCAKEIAQPSFDNNETFKWNVDATKEIIYDTKTVLDANQLKWEVGDKMGLFISGRQTNRIFTNSSGDNFSGSLVKGEANSDAVNYYAYYPYQPGVEDISSINAVLPETQTAPFDASATFMTAEVVTAPYDESNMPSIAFQFKNHLFSLLKLVITNSDEALKEQKLLGVTLEATDGAFLAGSFHFDATIANPEANFEATGNSSTVKMEYKTGEEPTIGSGISHELVLTLNPVTLNGIKVTVRTTDYVFILNSSKNVTLDKGTITVLPQINLSGLEKKKRIRTCLLWGDSITNVSYLNKMKELLGDDWNVIRGGVSGDSPLGICGRQGAIPLYMFGPSGEGDKSFTIPASKSESVLIDRLSSSRTTSNLPGYSVKVGGPGYFNTTGGLFNPCILTFNDGTKDIQIAGNVTMDESKNYYFTRAEDGDAIYVPDGAKITTYAATAYRDADVHIIYMGANRGFATYDALTQFHQAMIDYTTSKKVVVLGFHMAHIVWPNTSSFTYWTPDYRDAMQNAFGSRFVDMRTVVNSNPLKYLVASGAYTKGQALSEEDLDAVNNGDWPSSLQNAYGTDVHPNPFGNYVMAILAVEKMKELGYLNY